MDLFLKEPPIFDTNRFTVIPLTPIQGCNLANTLLQDEALATEVPWLTKKTQEGAQDEASNIERWAAAGQLKMWSVLSKELQIEVGAIIARNTLEGVDVEVLVASSYWGNQVGEEAGQPVLNWLEENPETFDTFPILFS